MQTEVSFACMNQGNYEDWDQMSFDADYDTLALDHFEPMGHRVYAPTRQVFD